MRAIDLDANATKPASAAAWEAYRQAAEFSGAQARACIEQCRARIAQQVGAHADEVVWTRGGSHANQVALSAAIEASALQTPTLALSRIEHRASVETALELEQQGRAHLLWLPVDADGHIKPPSLDAPSAILSALIAHNETGVVQPVADLARACHQMGAVLHLDGVQALGRLPLPWSGGSASMMSLAGHKMGSLGGIGVLLVRRHTPLHERCVLAEGARFAGGFAYAEGEAGASAGLCASMAAAVTDVKLHVAKEAKLHLLRDALEARLTSALAQEGVELTIIGQRAARLPNTSLLRLHGIEAEALLMALDVRGFSASSGAACKAGAIEPSASVLAMGFSPPAAREVIRVSLSWPQALPNDPAPRSLPDELGRFVDAVLAIARSASR